MFKVFDDNINSLIAEFAGTKENWKLRFTIDVLPCIEKGYKFVAIFDGEPCLNCYAYSDGINSFCYNDDINTSEYTLMSFDEYHSGSMFNEFSYFDFKQFSLKSEIEKIDYREFMYGLHTEIVNSKLYKELHFYNYIV